MSKEFVDLLQELFPPITAPVKERLQRLISGHINDPLFIYETAVLNLVSQGDVFTNIPFVTLCPDNQYTTNRMFGMLISTSCDFENEEEVLLAPGYTMDYFKEAFGEGANTLLALRNNCVYDKFYLPAYLALPELVFDFNGINSFKTEYVRHTCASGNSQRVASLKQNGYYYLLTKLTVHFLRPDAPEIHRADL